MLDVICHHCYCRISADVIASVLAEPRQQQQQAVSEPTHSNAVDEDGLFPILDSITVIAHTYFADDACSDESDGEVKVELA